MEIDDPNLQSVLNQNLLDKFRNCCLALLSYIVRLFVVPSLAFKAFFIMSTTTTTLLMLLVLDIFGNGFQIADLWNFEFNEFV